MILDQNRALENSMYGEAVRLYNEFLPKPQQTIQTINGSVTIPAKSGIDVLNDSLATLGSQLLTEVQAKNKVRVVFLLRVIAMRFPAFDISTKTNNQKIINYFTKLQNRTMKDENFLGESGHGNDADGNFSETIIEI